MTQPGQGFAWNKPVDSATMRRVAIVGVDPASRTATGRTREQSEIDIDTSYPVGGLVVTGTVQREPNSLNVRFTISDGVASMPVSYAGILPDLFREGQGIVAQGAFGADRTFHASQVLAKHDENYMPREVADRLKEKGEWRPDGPETRSSRPQADSAPTRL